MCIWCNERGRAFYSLDAVQRHMRDKGHCKLLYEGDAVYEYADYYDFRLVKMLCQILYIHTLWELPNLPVGQKE